MSIQSEITRITNARDSSFTAVAAKGVTVPSGSTIGDLPALILQINAGGGGNILTAQNVNVTSSAWSSDSTYTDFPNKASITIEGATASMYPEVVYSPTDALSGYYAPVAATDTNSVIIYAKDDGAVAITIPTIIVQSV